MKPWDELTPWEQHQWDEAAAALGVRLGRSYYERMHSFAAAVRQARSAQKQLNDTMQSLASAMRCFSKALSDFSGKLDRDDDGNVVACGPKTAG